MRKITKFLIIPLLYLSSAFCVKPLTLTEKLQDRNRKYPTANYNKVMQISPHRTGSTLVYNILRYLFEDGRNLHSSGFNNKKHKVIKSHVTYHFNFDREIYFVTVRNPEESFYSWCRAHSISENDKKFTSHIEEDIECWKEIDSLLQKKKEVVVLRYEEFIKDTNIIFDAIEKAFNINIDKTDKDFLTKTLSKENVLAFSKQISSFSKADPCTNIHGKHIQENSDIDIALQKAIEKHLLPSNAMFNRWGYDLIKKPKQI